MIAPPKGRGRYQPTPLSLMGETPLGAAGLAPVDIHLVSDNVASVRMEPFSWAALKRALRRGEIAIEGVGRRRGSQVEHQGVLQPLQINRAVPRAGQCERHDKQ